MSITIIGPNPAIDHTLQVPGFRLGEVHRTAVSIRGAGGKPVNVARTVRRLGEAALLVAPLGGEGRRVIEGAASELDIVLWTTPIHAPTREAYIIVDSADGSCSVVNEEGPELSAREAGEFERLAVAALREGDPVVASGSLPPDLNRDFYGRLAAEARKLEARFILDTSGEALRLGLEGRPWCVKVNRHELADATGISDPREGAEALIAHGIEHVIVTLGVGGALYCSSTGAFHVTAAPVAALNPTAAGDAFMAGIAVELARGHGWEQALRLGSAAAALVTSQLGPDIGPNPEVEALVEAIQITARWG
jgi:1-phosphofructokinase family hexose kinase